MVMTFSRTAEVKGVENDTSKSKQTVPLSGAAAKEGSSQAEVSPCLVA